MKYFNTQRILFVLFLSCFLLFSTGFKGTVSAVTETVAGAAQSDAAPATGETTSKTESMSDGPVSQAGQAAALSEKIIGINVGIVGAYKNGIQVPVTVTCQTTSVLETVELESVDSDGTPVRLSCSREKLKTETEGNVTRVEINFSPGHANGKLTVRCKTSNTPGGFAKTISPGMSEEDPAFRFEQPLPLPRPVVLVVGDDNIGLKEAFGEVRINENRRPEIRTVNSWKDLPQTPDGYEVVDTLVLTTTTPEILQDVTPEDPRAQAIFDWVRLGGKFVLIAGEHSIPLLSEHKVWKKFLPGKTVAPKLHEFRMANVLVQAVPNAKNLVMTGSRDYPFLNVPVVSDLNPDMTIEIQEQETPLLTRWVCGLGTMTWFAAELSSPPLSNWSGRTVLVAKIFGLEVQNIEQKTTQNSLVQLGYHDISGELRSALDQFDGITIIPFSLILVLLFLYLLIVGPGDWYLTHHLLKRPNLTWLTLPFYVILFCVLTVAIVRHTRPREVQVNQVDLVDLDTVTGTVRGTTWCGVYSPKDAQYNLRFVPKDDFPIGEKTAPTTARFNWLGLQGSGLGGMSPQMISPQFWKSPYSMTGNRLEQLPIQVRASKSLFGRWVGQREEVSLSDLTITESYIRGTVTNPFDFPLENAVLFYEHWAVWIGTMPPGEMSFSKKSPHVEQNRYLGSGEKPFDMSRKFDSIVGYNTRSGNPAYILRMMMFYRLIGGEDVIGLNNALQKEIDLSDLLQNHRAILTATVRDGSLSKFRSVAWNQRNSAPAPVSDNQQNSGGNSVSDNQPLPVADIPIGAKICADSPDTPDQLFGTRQEASQNGLNHHSVIVRFILPIH